ncbi:MAG: hypothetical protein HQM14_20235 [SAR324 cluster bacterium]|nr:hypothetical protein [SAR324 cluster bacterium]
MKSRVGLQPYPLVQVGLVWRIWRNRERMGYVFGRVGGVGRGCCQKTAVANS